MTMKGGGRSCGDCAMRCLRCGQLLCFQVDDGCRFRGHYVHSDGVYCTACWEREGLGTRMVRQASPVPEKTEQEDG